MLSIAQAAGKALRPPPRISIADWADEHRMLPSTSAEPGRWRTDRTPYMRELMDCLAPGSSVRELAFMKSAQVGGTELILNAIGHAMMIDPGPMLIVQPTEDTARSWSDKRLAPMIRATAGLRDLFGASQRNPRNKTTYKEWAGGFLRVAWSRSAPQLRSDPIRDVLLDEVDGYPPDVEGEGDPVDLAIARTRTFSDRRRVVGISTPTIKGSSRIERWYLEGDQRKFHVPCPHCASPFVLEMSLLSRVDGGAVVCTCPECQQQIDESEKSRMLARGEWVATSESISPDFRSYHISALYAPAGWYSWRDVMDAYDKATASDDDKALRTFYNTILGLPYEAKEVEEVDWKPLYMRRNRDLTRGIVPSGVGVLTAGADVQADRIECEIVGWGLGLRSWSVDYVVLHGNPTQSEVWQQLTHVLEHAYPGERGALFSISRMAVDSGNWAQEVYEWAATVGMRLAMPVKGASHTLPMLVAPPAAVEMDVNGRKRAMGVQVRRVNTEAIKDYIKRSLELPFSVECEPPERWCEFPDYGPGYFEQLCSEQRVFKGGRWRWEKPTETTRNEALDCRVYAHAAMFSLGVDRWSAERWDQVFSEIRLTVADEAADKHVSQVVRRRERRHRDSSYLQR